MSAIPPGVEWGQDRRGLPPAAGMYRPAVHGNGLAGDEVAIGRAEEDERADQVLRVAVALDGAARHDAVAGEAQMVLVGEDRVAQREPRRQRVDANVVG